jgi:hypothetical protein
MYLVMRISTFPVDGAVHLSREHDALNYGGSNERENGLEKLGIGAWIVTWKIPQEAAMYE